MRKKIHKRSNMKQNKKNDGNKSIKINHFENTH